MCLVLNIFDCKYYNKRFFCIWVQTCVEDLERKEKERKYFIDINEKISRTAMLV